MYVCMLVCANEDGVDGQLDGAEDALLQHRPPDRGHGDGHAFESQRALHSKDQRGGQLSPDSQQGYDTQLYWSISISKKKILSAFSF